MMNQDRSHVAVLIPKELAPLENEEEKLAREALESKGKFLYGTWELKEEIKGDSQPGFDSMGDYIKTGFGHLEFAPDGNLIKGAAGMKPDATKTLNSPQKSLFGSLLSAITGSTEQATELLASQESQWRAIHVIDNKLSVVTVESEVEAFGMTIEFLENEEAKFAFFYGEPAQAGTYGTFIFKRISLEACGKDCTDCAEKSKTSEQAIITKP